MHRDASQSPARVLAPLALALCTFAFFYVIFTSGSGDEGGGGGRTSTSQRTTATTEQSQAPRPRRSTYTVKTGDTLGAIAAKTGVTVERLQELNPGLDPQALVSGQKIKLRE
jgi:LysM repeat protein